MSWFDNAKPGSRWRVVGYDTGCLGSDTPVNFVPKLGAIGTVAAASKNSRLQTVNCGGGESWFLEDGICVFEPIIEEESDMSSTKYRPGDVVEVTGYEYPIENNPHAHVVPPIGSTWTVDRDGYIAQGLVIGLEGCRGYVPGLYVKVRLLLRASNEDSAEPSADKAEPTIRRSVLEAWIKEKYTGLGLIDEDWEQGQKFLLGVLAREVLGLRLSSRLETVLEPLE